jgi:hypothetical protein
MKTLLVRVRLPHPCNSQGACHLTVVDVRDLAEVEHPSTPRPFDEPKSSVSQVRDVDENSWVINGGMFGENSQWVQPQTPAYQLFSHEQTSAFTVPTPLESPYPPSAPCSTPMLWTSLAFAVNGQLNQPQMPAYQPFPSEPTTAWNPPAPLGSLDSPSAPCNASMLMTPGPSGPSQRYGDIGNQDYQIPSDFLAAQSDPIAHGHSASPSSPSSGVRNSDPTATTSVTPASNSSQPSRSEICRCKRHEDRCKLGFSQGTETCTGCQGIFTWSRKADPFIDVNEIAGHICRCKWHEKRCLEFREQYDAGKCIGCGGWFAFSKCADSLLKLPEMPREDGGSEDEYMSLMLNLDDSATTSC